MAIPQSEILTTERLGRVFTQTNFDRGQSLCHCLCHENNILMFNIMKKLTSLFFLFVFNFMLTGCGSLKAPIVQQNESLKNYTYFYITPTSDIISGSGGVYGGKNGVYGGSSSKTINPSDIISGTLMKQGMIRLPELDSNLLDKTLIVNYGESGRRNLNFGYTIEVTIQFLSAMTHSVVCVCTAEGQGHTESDDIRIAINRALNELLKQ